MFDQKAWLKQQKEYLALFVSCTQAGRRRNQGVNRRAVMCRGTAEQSREDGTAIGSEVVWKKWVKGEGRAKGHFQKNSIWWEPKGTHLNFKSDPVLSFFSTTLLSSVLTPSPNTALGTHSAQSLLAIPNTLQTPLGVDTGRSPYSDGPSSNIWLLSSLPSLQASSNMLTPQDGLYSALYKWY